MSRGDGFAIMDVSTDIVNDPKVRKLFRLSPDHASAAFIAFIATLGESWKAGRRVKIDDAWPGYLDYDTAAVAALVTVGLLDKRGLLSLKAWEGWFGVAKSRRTASREKWRKENEKRRGNGAVDEQSPRGDYAVTTPTVPLRSSPSVPILPGRPSVPSTRARDETEELLRQRREEDRAELASRTRR